VFSKAKQANDMRTKMFPMIHLSARLLNKGHNAAVDSFRWLCGDRVLGKLHYGSANSLPMGQIHRRLGSIAGEKKVIWVRSRRTNTEAIVVLSVLSTSLDMKKTRKKI
jgi:hypothetical protein